MTERADWDIVTGVGFTALAVAAARSVETHRPEPLVDDPYAEAFVEAARSPVPMPTGPDRTADPSWVLMSTYMGVRSRFFDTYFADAQAAGVDQVVVLAAGLDTRAYRLDWAPGTVFYELDVPKVLAFKAQVLAERGALPRCERRPVAIDLRDDWSAALLAAGLRRDRPTAWLAEGLLPFLPDDATAHLLGTLHELSAPGSLLAAEQLDGDVAELAQQPPMRDMAATFGFTVLDMWPAGKTFDPVSWLAERDWTVQAAHADQVGASYGRPFGEEMAAMRQSLLVTARRT